MIPTNQDQHPGILPGIYRQCFKLEVAKDSGLILSGSVYGGCAVGEVVSVIGLAIQDRMTISEVLTAQIDTHPLLTIPPTAYPLIIAAESALKKFEIFDMASVLAGAQKAAERWQPLLFADD